MRVVQVPELWNGSRDGSAVKGNLMLLQKTWFSSQHPLGGSQLAILAVPGDPALASGLCKNQALMRMHIQADKTVIDRPPQKSC